MNVDGERIFAYRMDSKKRKGMKKEGFYGRERKEMERKGKK